MNEELRASALTPLGRSDASVKVEPIRKPQRIPFDPEPISPEKPNTPWIPVSLRRRVITYDATQSPTARAERYGLFWLRILRPLVLGPGKYGEPGDLVQLDGSLGLLLAGSDPAQAEFVRDQQALADEKQIEDLKKKGFKVESPAQRMVDREEFKEAVAVTKKKPRWPILE